MTLELAISKILSIINSNTETEGPYRIDDDRIVDHGFAWYIPFHKSPTNNEISVGLYLGYFVDKTTGEMFQPGSAYTLDKWLRGFKIGLRYRCYDLHILKIGDRNRTIQLLEKLNLKYYVEEMDGVVVWRIPQSFSEKMLAKRLRSIPAVFRNQGLTFSIDIFEEIIRSKAFEFKLMRNDCLDESFGENLTQEGYP